MMRNTTALAFASLLVFLAGGVALAQDKQPPDKQPSPPAADKAAKNAGQSDLDKATEAKLTSKTLSDLGAVIKLCRSALEKGLDEENAKFAKTLLGSTLIQRGTAVAGAVLEGSPLDPRLGRFRRVALADLELGVTMSPDQPEALLLIAKLHLLPGGDAKKAARALDGAIKYGDNAPKTKAKALVMRAGLEQDAKKRLADLNEAIKIQPGDPVAIRARGLVYADEGEYDRALADLDAALKLDPKHAPTYEAKALVLAKQEKYDEAVAALAKAREVEPKSVAPLVQQARVHAMQMNLQAAVDDLDQAHKMEPDNLAVLLLRASVYQELGEDAKAMADVEQILRLRPGLPTAMRFRAMLLADAKKLDEALAVLRELIEKHPEDEQARLQLAMLHAVAERPRKAIEIYSALLEKDADNWIALRGRGDAYLSIGRHAEAIADFDRAMKLHPDDDGILNNLAWVLATSPDDKLRNGKRAIELATKACELTEYKAGHILSTLAAAYAETGDFKTAMKWSAKAVEIGREEHKEELKKELESYKKGKPWRELQQTKEKPEPKPKPKEKPEPEKPLPNDADIL